jgi:rod shape-determining protein MreD
MSALLLMAFVALLLRSTALSGFAGRGVFIDVLAFAVVVWALRHGASWGATFGFVLGLFADLDTAHWLGRHALALTLLGYVTGRLASTLVRESAGTQFVLLLSATVAHQAWAAAFDLAGGSAWTHLVVRTAVSAIATSVLGTALLVLVRQVGGRPLFGHASIQPGKTI